MPVRKRHREGIELVCPRVPTDSHMTPLESDLSVDTARATASHWTRQGVQQKLYFIFSVENNAVSSGCVSSIEKMIPPMVSEGWRAFGVGVPGYDYRICRD